MGNKPIELAPNPNPVPPQPERGAKFPMHVHKPDGVAKDVNNEEELKAALKDGWAADVRDVVAHSDETPAKKKGK